MASGKRTLTVQQRLDVLQEVETMPVDTVAAKYNVHPTTIRRVIQHAPVIKQLAEKGEKHRTRQRIRPATYKELEEQLMEWFIQRRLLGESISDALLIEKATKIKEDIPSCINFKASRGWLHNFKRRHNIQLRKFRGERSSEDLTEKDSEQDAEAEDAGQDAQAEDVGQDAETEDVGQVAEAEDVGQDAEAEDVGQNVKVEDVGQDVKVEYVEIRIAEGENAVSRASSPPRRPTHAGFVPLNEEELEKAKEVFEWLEEMSRRGPSTVELQVKVLKNLFLGNSEH